MIALFLISRKDKISSEEIPCKGKDSPILLTIDFPSFCIGCESAYRMRKALKQIKRTVPFEMFEFKLSNKGD